MQEEVQEGPEEKEAVPEDLLRARLRRLNGRTLPLVRWRFSLRPAARSQLFSSDMASVKTIAKRENFAGPAQTRLRALGPDKNKEVV